MTEFIVLFLIFYVWHMLGITIGYHRLISHRSFACSKAMEYFLVLPAYLAFEGSPVWWATIHRAHHRHVDTPLDPHSPIYSLREAAFGWFLKDTYASHIDPNTQSKDLMKDPIYRFLDQDGSWPRAGALVFTIGFLFRALIWACFGPIPALASLAAGLIAMGVPLGLNVLCHIPKLGYKNYPSADDSVNIWWMNIFVFGEGWHSNHHIAPGSARSGVRPWEFDLSWLMIVLMKKLSLIGRVSDWDAKRLDARYHCEKSSEKQLQGFVADTLTPVVVPSAMSLGVKERVL